MDETGKAPKGKGWRERFPAWFNDFFKAHMIRCPRSDWPRPGSPAFPIFFEPWAEAFVDLKIAPEEATAASKTLARQGPGYLSDHLKALVDQVEHNRQAGITTPSEREQAERLSADCPNCGGGGLASIEHMHPERGRYSVSYLCVCPIGRWIKGKHDRDPKAPKLRDLALHPDLQVRADDPPDPRHLEIGEWFAARRRAAAEGTPRPPTPDSVIEVERAYAERKRPIPGKAAPLPVTRRNADGTAPKAR